MATLPWYARWLVFARWGALHAVRDLADPAAVVEGGSTSLGLTACGRRGRLQVPGVLSRLALRRCLACCRRTLEAPGVGNPYNALPRARRAPEAGGGTRGG